MYKAYKDELLKFEHPVFLTLTVRSYCGNGELLRKVLSYQSKLFSEILRKGYRQKRNIKGIRVFEIVPHSENNRYHVHVHCIINTKENAEFIKAQWLENSYKYYFNTENYLQKIVPIKGIKGIKEVFKYQVKLFDKNKKTIDFDGVNYVHENTFHFKMIQKFGIKKASDKLTKDDITNIEGELITDIESGLIAIEKQWQEGDQATYIHAKDINTYDWINNRTGEGLTDYKPTAKERAYFEPKDIEKDKRILQIEAKKLH